LYQTNKASNIPGLDDEVKTHFNSIGFRGPEKPSNYDSCLTIFTVGGSTTFCLYLSEGKTWPDLLSKNLQNDYGCLWLNNAGINGHSTFGHQILLEDYIIQHKPKVVIFMTGINDLGKDKLTDEKTTLKDSCSNSFRVFLMKNSEVYNLLMTINGGLKVKKFGLPLPNVDLRNKHLSFLTLPESVIASELKRDSVYVSNYGQRIKKLAETCISNKILPIFITQPILGGNAIDDITGINLQNIKMGDSVNSGLIAIKLEKYNQELVRVAQQMHVAYIDLASSMPKSSKYYFDLMHFTNEGAVKVADLVDRQLRKILDVDSTVNRKKA
jgi:lysophospholipase L1-like esterase